VAVRRPEAEAEAVHHWQEPHLPAIRCFEVNLKRVENREREKYRRFLPTTQQQHQEEAEGSSSEAAAGASVRPSASAEEVEEDHP
jgi:hypothetical protein